MRGGASVRSTVWERARESKDRKARLEIANLRTKIGKGQRLSVPELEVLNSAAKKGLLSATTLSSLLVLDGANRGEIERVLREAGGVEFSPEGLENLEKLRLARIFSTPSWRSRARACYAALEAKAFGLESWRGIELEKISIELFEASPVADTALDSFRTEEALALGPFVEMLEVAFAVRRFPTRKVDLSAEIAAEFLELLEPRKGASREIGKFRVVFAPLIEEIIGAALLESVEPGLALARYESIVSDVRELEPVYRERITWLSRR